MSMLHCVFHAMLHCVFHVSLLIFCSYKPTVFREWFLTSWPEPSAWLSSRLAYSRTLAVMSMIGYILG